MTVGLAALICVGLVALLGYFLFTGSAPGTVEVPSNQGAEYNDTDPEATNKPTPRANNQPRSNNQPNIVENTDTPAANTEPVVSIEEPMPEFDGVKPANCAVTGIIRTPEGDTAPNVHVYLVVKRKDRWIEIVQVVTEKDGRFAIGNADLLAKVEGVSSDSRGYTPIPLQAGDYRLELRATHYLYTASEFALSSGVATKNLQLRPMTKTDVTFDIVNLDGKEASRLHVSSFARDGGVGGILDTRFTDDESNKEMRVGEKRTPILATPDRAVPSRFSVEVRALADVTFTFTQPGYTLVDPEGGELHLDLSDGLPKTTQLRFEPRDRDRVSPRGRGESSITGRITSTMPGLDPTDVRLMYRGDEAHGGARINPDGSYEIVHIPDGRYELTLSHGKLTCSIVKDVDVIQQAYADFFVSGTTISFELDPNAVDLLGAIIQVGNRKNPRIFYQAVESSHLQGHVYTPDVQWTPGEYVAELVTKGGTLADSNPDGRMIFTVGEGMSSLTIPLRAQATATARIQIIDEEGYGWAGGEVRLVSKKHFRKLDSARRSGTRPDWEGSRLVALDNLGRVTIDRLLGGEYKLLIWTRSRDASSWDAAKTVKLSGGETSDFLFTIKANPDE